MDIYSAISNSSIFKELSEPSRRKLSTVCFCRHIKKREVLFVEGDEGHSLYILLSGNIQLAKISPGGVERVIKIIQPGEVFGEVILFEQDRYPVTATSLNECLVLLCPKKGFHHLLAEEGFRNDFIAVLLRKQRYLADKIFSLTSYDVEERLFQFFREHFGDSRSVEMSISKKDVAAAIGVAPETLSRLVQKLESEGRLSWKGRKIEME